jgi:putative transposase
VKNSRFSQEQIIGILKQSEAGAKTSELCRQHGISAATLYGWRSKYGGMDVSEAKRLKQLEEENSKLKRIVADQALDITMLKDLVGKNVWSGSSSQEKTS